MQPPTTIAELVWILLVGTCGLLLAGIIWFAGKIYAWLESHETDIRKLETRFNSLDTTMSQMYERSQEMHQENRETIDGIRHDITQILRLWGPTRSGGAMQ